MCLKYSNSSQRSRVKGTLEVYHAYVSDSINIVASEAEITSDSGGWELLNQPTPTSNNSPVEQTTEVPNFLVYSYRIKDNLKLKIQITCRHLTLFFFCNKCKQCLILETIKINFFRCPFFDRKYEQWEFLCFWQVKWVVWLCCYARFWHCWKKTFDLNA